MFVSLHSFELKAPRVQIIIKAFVHVIERRIRHERNDILIAQEVFSPLSFGQIVLLEIYFSDRRRGVDLLIFFGRIGLEKGSRAGKSHIVFLERIIIHT